VSDTPYGKIITALSTLAKLPCDDDEHIRRSPVMDEVVRIRANADLMERENAALRSELEGVRKDVAIFREALIHIGQHMQTDEQSAYMPLNEWIGHASVDDARKRDRELIDAAIAQGEGEK